MAGAPGEGTGDIQRVRLTVRGAVQGVGFRPFVFRLATGLGLTGWVSNSSQGVVIEIEGATPVVRNFLLRIERERPPRSFIQSLESSFLDPTGYATFEIRPSIDTGGATALVLPDIATCPDCLNEILDPGNRRFQYPFTNCTNCGPRFTIIESLPYDRPKTTMKVFELCEDCRAEYENPLDRRFHAQPNACPRCGPHLELWTPQGQRLASRHDALLGAAAAIRRGDIVAVKGLGGFHLVVDARRDEPVERLRTLKRREEKPLALMFPSLQGVERECDVSDLEARLLASPESPIVLLQRRTHSGGERGEIASAVAPGNPTLGIMLPYTPLHHLLMRELGFPVVATSGNRSDEPICTDEHDALDRLAGLADVFLVHDRPIFRHVDDSIARVVLGRELVLRRSRGYAPLPVHLKKAVPAILAVGAHLKNTIATSVGQDVFISQHIGDLETVQAFTAFERVIDSFRQLYGVAPTTVACDAHPNYLSGSYARRSGLPVVPVQHHYAHVLSCMAESEIDGPVLGISWDGTGYGPDGTVWGGEFLLTTFEGFMRVAHLRCFSLPGGEKAVEEPRRTALGVLFEIFGDSAFEMSDLEPIKAFSRRELSLLKTMLGGRVNTPRTSSAGRLFDAVASLAGLRQQVRFEGQAAMELEFAAAGVAATEASYLCPVRPEQAASLIVDWEPLIRETIDDVRRGVPVATISAKFHNGLVEAMVAVARKMSHDRVVLTGGCFQNRYLIERAVRRLREEGFQPYWHQRIPPNDGGIALGQVLAAAGVRVRKGR